MKGAEAKVFSMSSAREAQALLRDAPKGKHALRSAVKQAAHLLKCAQEAETSLMAHKEISCNESQGDQL